MGPVPAARLDAATLCSHAKQTDLIALQQRFDYQDILRTSQASVSLAPYSTEHFTPALHQRTLSTFGVHSEDQGLAADQEPFPRHASPAPPILHCKSRNNTGLSPPVTHYVTRGREKVLRGIGSNEGKKQSRYSRAQTRPAAR